MRGDHKDSERTDRHSSRVASAASPVQKSPNTPTPAAQPVQNSPNTPTPAAQPVQNSPNTPKIAHFSPFCPSRENFVPLAPPRPPAGRTLYRAQRQTRYKTLPARPVRRPSRYKILPTRPKRPISASFAPAGRTLYRSHHHDAQQGELCTAPSTTPGTKLSQHAHTSSPTGTKLSQHTHTSSPTGTKLSQHTQKGPFQPVLHEQGELSTAPSTTTPSRENFVPLPVPNPVQNSPSAPASSPTGTKLSQHAPTSSPTGTKLSQHAPASSPTGTKLSQHTQNCPFQPVLPEQGELCTAHKANPGTKLPLLSRPTGSPGTKLSQHAQKGLFQPVLPEQGELCTAPRANPGTKLSLLSRSRRSPGTKLSPHTQKGQFQPVLPQQGELCTAATTKKPSRENFLPHPATPPIQNSPSAPVLQRFREKVRPAHLKKAFFASFAPAGRIFSRTSKQQATQGELLRALGIEQEVLTKVVCADI